MLAANSAAKELILFAKNRMQKFYNPKMYKPAPKNPPGGIAGTGVSFVQVRQHDSVETKRDAPPPPPEAKFGGKKSEESGGVLAMMDLLVAEVDKEITTAKLEEADAQDDYEKLMSESSNKRATDSKAIVEKTAAKAASETELQAVKEYIVSLHTECDFLLEYYDQR